ncbi:MAG TPA: caspase family protein [Bacteroidales bacterium]|nr:caspase family protein [Bacteroidales bacterium]
MKLFKYAIFIALPFLVSNCAAIFYGRNQKVYINSEPAGASLFVNGVDTRKTTPCTIKVKRRQPEGFINKKNEIVYVLKKENYYDGEFRDYAKKDYLPVYLDAIYITPGIFDLLVGASTKTFTKNVSVKLNEKGKTIVKTDTVVKKEVVYVNAGTKEGKYVFERKSDVDIDIPEVGKEKENRYALIIGNEDYSSRQIDLNTEINVDFARNDASAFKEYAIKVLGIPENQVIFMLDATTGQMKQGISKLNLIIKNTDGEAEVFVYYAGHGLPDEVTKEPYLMPVDVSGKNAADGIKLKDMYDKLTEFPSKRITVFIDACFSGGARNQGLLAARGVKVKAKEAVNNGNIIVFSASSGEQSSLPYKAKEHGFFTYFLLKKLKETQGNVNYSELSAYLKKNVSLQSVLLNDKEQTPQVNVSQSMIDAWGNISIK